MAVIGFCVSRPREGLVHPLLSGLLRQCWGAPAVGQGRFRCWAPSQGGFFSPAGGRGAQLGWGPLPGGNGSFLCKAAPGWLRGEKTALQQVNKYLAVGSMGWWFFFPPPFKTPPARGRKHRGCLLKGLVPGDEFKATAVLWGGGGRGEFPKHGAGSWPLPALGGPEPVPPGLGDGRGQWGTQELPWASCGSCPSAPCAYTFIIMEEDCPVSLMSKLSEICINQGI